MFAVGKILWAVLAPGNLLLIGLVACWMAIPARRARGAKRLAGFMALVSVLIACTPVGILPMVLLEGRFARPAARPAHVDGIVVLGGGIFPLLAQARDEAAIGAGNPRLGAFVALARAYPDARLVFTGGSGDLLHPGMKEAPVAREALQRIGLDTARVTFESRSRDTYENAVFSKALVQPKPGQVWLLVTSASQMPRAVAVFRAQDWPVIAWPVGYWTTGHLWSAWAFDFPGRLQNFQTGIHEWVGLVAYYLRGYTREVFPAP